jgi:hypothetical protein
VRLRRIPIFALFLRSVGWHAANVPGSAIDPLELPKIDPVTPTAPEKILGLHQIAIA